VPGDALTEYIEGLLAFAGGHGGHATRVFERLARMGPPELRGRARYHVALSHLLSGSPEDAVSALAEWRGDGDARCREPRALLLEALAQLGVGRLEEAEALAREVVAIELAAPRQRAAAEEIAVCSMLMRGRDSEALASLREDSDLLATPRGAYYEGLALARSGDHHAGTASLLRAMDDPVCRPRAVEALRTILDATSRRLIAAENWEGAARALDTWAHVDPGNEEVRSRLRQIGAHYPLALLRAGDRAAAAAALESHRSRCRSSDSSTAHPLALIYTFWARALEDKSAPEADEAWLCAVENWGAVIGSDSFWKDWPARRQQAFGQAIPASAPEELRRRLVEDVPRLLAEPIAAARARGDDGHAERLERLMITSEVELRAALLLAEFSRQDGSRRLPGDPPACGPRMLRRLGHLGPVSEAVGKAALSGKLRNGTSGIVWLLGDLAVPWLLLEHHGADRALAELNAAPSSLRGSAQWRELVVRAHVGMAEQRIDTSAEIAVQSLRAAAEHAGKDKALLGLVREAADRAAEALIRTLADDGDAERWGRAGRLLEDLAAAVPGPGVWAAVAQALAQAVWCEIDVKKPPSERRCRGMEGKLRRAMEFDSSNARAREALARLCLIRGQRELERGHSPESAVDAGLEFAEDNWDFRSGASGLLSEYAVKIANETHRGSAQWDEAGRLLKRALDMNPKNEHARDSLRRWLGP
jgi:tetratricopeptide (TPR) repeat protein